MASPPKKPGKPTAAKAKAPSARRKTTKVADAKAVAPPKPAPAPRAAKGHTSVVVVTYHTGPVLWLCLRAVLKQADLRGLVLVNNGNPPSVESRLARLAESDARITLLTGHGNIGFGAACNLGVRAARGDYVMLLNPDAVLPDGALTRARRTLDANPDAGLLGALHVNPDGTVQPNSARHLLTPLKVVSEVAQLYRVREDLPGLNLPLASHKDAPFAVPAVSGALLFCKTAVYHDVGGMDERFFLHFEDMDFCQSVHDKGFGVVLDPGLRVQHHKSSSKVSSWKLEYHKAKSLSAYFEKRYAHLPTWQQVALEVGVWGMFPLVAALKAVRGALRWREPESAREIRKILLLDQVNQRVAVADSGQTVLVTGATALTGLAVVRALLEAGHVVCALRHRRRVDFAHPRLVWVEGNLERTDGLRLGNLTFDAAVHAADPAFLPRHVQLMAQHGCKRLVLISPAFAGNDATIHQTERHISGLCEQLDVALITLKPAVVYGYGLDDTISRLAYRLHRFPVLLATHGARGAFQPLHVDDLAQAAAQALTVRKAAGKTYPLPGGSALTMADVMRQLGALLGVKPHMFRLPAAGRLQRLLRRAFGPPSRLELLMDELEDDLLLDSEAAHADLDITPRPFLAAGLDDVGEHLAFR